MSARPAKEPAPPNPAKAEGLRLASALGRLLDRARGAREVLPHLAALERALMNDGVEAINLIPENWLGRIASQLSSLPLPPEEPALHELLQRLSSRLDRGSIDWQEPSGPGGFDPERTVVIREISHSEFMAASDEQATTMPLPMSER